MAERYHSYIISKARPVIVLLLVLGLLTLQYEQGLYSAVSWLLMLFLAYMYRDPDRHVPSDPLAVIAPVDGKVLSVREVNNPYLDKPAIRVRIRKRMLGTFPLRSPMEGQVMERWLVYTGQKLPDGSHATAMQIGNWIHSDEGDDIVIVVYKGTPWFASRCLIQSGERVGQGQRCGMMSFRNVVDLYVQPDCRLNVEKGERLKAGESVIGRLTRSSDTTATAEN